MKKEGLSVDVGGLQLRNPCLLASGIQGLTGASLKRVWEAGAGAVITKSVSREAREGYSGPRVVGTSCGLINSMGLPNPGIENILDEVETVKNVGATVLGSVFGGGAEEFATLTSRMEEAGVDAVELNLSCPHAGELLTVGQNPELTGEVVEACNDSKIPVWAKLPGNTHTPTLVEVAKSAEGAGADALVLINTLPAMAIDATAERPILAHDTGGLSGPAIKPISLRLVYGVYEEVDIPIVGAGGILDGEDMIEFILAGASAVEVGTGMLWKDLAIFEEVCEEARPYLEGRRVEELVGLAHRG